MLKIAFIFNHHFFLGGGEISFSELILKLERKSFKPLIIVPEIGQITEYFKDKNFSVVSTPFEPLKRIFPVTPIGSLFMLVKVLKRGQIDIIHANGSRACLYSTLAGRILGLPVLWHVRETIQDHFFYDGFMGLLAARILCVSKSVKQKRFSRFPRSIMSKIKVIHNGVNTDLFQSKYDSRKNIRSELGISDSNILFGIVGNMIPLKGQDIFLQALAKVYRSRPNIDIRALLIGRSLHKQYYAKLERLVSDLELKNQVLFIDHITDIPRIYSALDVFVLPSQREGFSRSILEAMSSGLPILATKISEIQEAVSEPENALLVEFGDIEGMASAVIKLAEDKEMQKTMGKNNRKKAVEKFDLKIHVKAIEAIYKEMIFSKT
ncbi:glycosyltransferase family 1 protein [Candidatus Parcubacteria bacterium]|nr:MAG: glycosyltransferase family 1 protein [Candidatus Parcubacteria bacterium]